MKLVCSLFLMLAVAAATASPAFADVSVSSPADGSTVPTSVRFAANAGTNCSSGVATVGIYVDDSLVYHVNGSSLNTNVNLAPGSHRAAVHEWDFCGGSSSSQLSLNVTNQQAQQGVMVISPTNGSTVAANAPFSATASTSCPSGVAAMGVYVNGQLKVKQNGNNLNASVYLGSGTQTAYVQEWDFCGGAAKTPVTVTVGSGGGTTAAVTVAVTAAATPSGGGTKLSNLQAVGNWNQWGQYPPDYNICNAPCPGISWAMYQHVQNSLSGNATQFNIGGSTPYADVLWSNKLIGQGTTLNMPDTDRTILPNIHHMTFDADVYINNIAVMQDLELDVNLFMNGVGMEFGTECDHLNGNVWDIWNDGGAHWIHTSIPCTMKDQSWNHVSFTVQREANNDLTYQTITVNGQTFNIYQTVAPFQVSSDWYGMTVNYQLDGDSHQDSYSTVLDNLSVTYW